MRKFVFTKMSGAGNDFILFDEKFNPGISLSPSEIKAICNRRNGIGADGVLILQETISFNYNLLYYNADGSLGSLCANGARCSLYYSKLMNWNDGYNISFTQNGNIYSGSVLNDENVKFNLNNPTNSKYNFRINAGGQSIPASFVDTGSPHVVINICDVLKDPLKPGSNFTDINDFPVFDLGREIRYHFDFAPAGTNVNFISLGENFVWIRTYERGVEDETLACGTGSVASALVVSKIYNAGTHIKLNVRSGDQLFVDFEMVGKEFEKVSLTGPAKVTFKGEITL